MWLEIIEYAKSQNKPIIFITDDNKEDWWRKHQGKTISPRTELIEEIKAEANVDFWMYTDDRFLMYAEEYLKLNEQPETIEEAEEVRLENENTVRSSSEKTEDNSFTPSDNYNSSIKSNDTFLSNQLSNRYVNPLENVDKVLKKHKFDLRDLENVMMPKINTDNFGALSKLIEQQVNAFAELSKELNRITKNFESYKFNVKKLENIMIPKINLRDIGNNINQPNERFDIEEE